MLAESVLLFRGNSDTKSRVDIAQTSSRFLTLLSTFNAATLDTQRAKILAYATGKFRADYQQVLDQTFLSALREVNADSKGRVLQVAVSSLTGDSATVLAIVGVSITNKNLTTPNVRERLFELSLVHTKDGWKIDAVTIRGELQ